jgi:hypothetical protein
MGTYRKDASDRKYRECNSIGCVIGHCTVLDDDANIYRIKHMNGLIDFVRWSEKFTGLNSNSDDWTFLFGGSWDCSDNTAIGASKRIRYYLQHGIPDDWEMMMYGETPICYN